jgi:hypothetical protein
MTTISSNFAAKVVLTPMAPGRDAEFAEMLDGFRAAGETHVYEGNFAVAREGYGPFYDLISKMKAGGYPKPEIVPMDSYFIETEGRILGEIFIRHRISGTGTVRRPHRLQGAALMPQSRSGNGGSPARASKARRHRCPASAGYVQRRQSPIRQGHREVRRSAHRGLASAGSGDTALLARDDKIMMMGF